MEIRRYKITFKFSNSLPHDLDSSNVALSDYL